MNFINVEWFLTAVTAVLHPFGILELISVHITDDGSTVRAEFHAETVRITVIDRISAAVINTIFIHLSRFCFRNVAFPEISIINLVHFFFLPVVEFTDHGDPGCGRCEGAEGYSVFFCMCTKILISIKNFSCVKSIEIHTHILLNIIVIVMDKSCFFNYTINRQKRFVQQQ